VQKGTVLFFLKLGPSPFLLTYSFGHYLYPKALKTGNDIFGYNYHTMMFNGLYANAYLGRYNLPPYEGDDQTYFQRLVTEGKAADLAAAQALAESTWVWPYRNDNLIMKWNDAWLANQDCDGDGLLDRHYGFTSYLDSGAWLTNHQSGTYEVNGNIYFWNYFVKIVAVSQNDRLVNEIWYKPDGTEIGPAIWGEFAIIQEVYNDTGTGDHGILYRSPAGPGLGKNW